MIAFATLFGADYIVEYDYKVTARGAPQTWEHPAEPFEFDVTFLELRKDEGTKKETPVECPKWLRDEIEQWLYDDTTGSVYEAIDEAERDRAENDYDERN